MITLKKLIAMTKKWQKLSRRQHVARKGHFVVYTMDKTRFVIPLAYLSSNLFRQLLKLSEEELGLPSDGPITLPCDAAFMEYVVNVTQSHLSQELHMALLVSLLAPPTQITVMGLNYYAF